MFINAFHFPNFSLNVQFSMVLISHISMPSGDEKCLNPIYEGEICVGRLQIIGQAKVDIESVKALFECVCVILLSTPHMYLFHFGRK